MILAPYKKKDFYGKMVTASDITSSTREGTGRVKSNRSTCENDNDNQSSMHKIILFNKVYVDPIVQYKRNWGISTICRLLGGGETTLPSCNGTASSGRGSSGTTPVHVSIPGTSNWNTSPLIGGQFPPNAVSNSPWRQSPQSSSTSSNNTSQTSNISKKGQSSNPGSSSGNSTISISKTTSQQNTTSWARSIGKNLPVSSVPQVTVNSSSLTTTARTGSGAVSNSQSSNSPPTNGENEAVNSSTKHINTIHAALYAKGGWGSQYVNKVSQWNVPHSPELNTKVGPLTGLTGSSGRSNINNGTDLWEATLRNGGKPPIQIPVQKKTYKTSWGHSVSETEANTGNWSIKPTTTMSNHQGQGQLPPQGLVRPLKKDIGAKGQSWKSGNTVFNDLNRPPRSIDQDPHCCDNRIVDHSREIGSDARFGISGCSNITTSGNSAVTEPLWSEPPPHHVQHHLQPPSVGSPPSVISSKHGQEPAPGGLLSTQHNMSKHWGKTDMTAAAGQNNNGSGNMGNECLLGSPPNRVSMPPPTSKKVDQQQLWLGNPRNGEWGDVSRRSQNDLNVASVWGDTKIGESENAGGLWPNFDWAPGLKSKNSLGDCGNNDMDQGFCGQKNINQNKDYIWQSKSFRILAENGVKKEDVEAVTRSYNISMEEALDLLMSSRGLGGGGLNSQNSHTGCGVHPNSFDQSNISQKIFNSQQSPFGVPSIGNNSNQQQVMSQKILAKQQPPAQQKTMQQQHSQGGGVRQMQFPLTTQHLALVKQIQIAVQAGYLNNQILNQPLSPQKLFMLSQLLQQIKVLQQNVQAVSNNPKSCPATMTASIAINKACQQITSLQNQIANNDDMNLKAQDNQNQFNFFGPSGPFGLTDGQVGDFFKKDPLTLLQSGFSDLVTNKDSEDDLGMPNGFSRAPGAISNSPLGITSTFNSLLSQGDGTCTNVGARSDSTWLDNVEDNKEIWPNNLSNSQCKSMSPAFTIDQVPEFEPGKLWKGNQMKNIDDDPTITPGSVVCSPLSLAVTMKDSNNSDSLNIGGKTSPTNSQSTVDMSWTPLFFTSPIWSYNPPPSSTQPSFNGQLGKVNEPKNNCSDSDLGSYLWGKSCGPPPYQTGRSDKTENVSNNGWPQWPSNKTSLGQFSSNNIDSTWLLLRNLKQQIDGSTLKTLGIQHGPLLNFYTYLNHGIALLKYSTREVAIKAQRALNNCVFRNTTIFAELPTNDEVEVLLTYLRGGVDNTSGNNSAQ